VSCIDSLANHPSCDFGVHSSLCITVSWRPIPTIRTFVFACNSVLTVYQVRNTELY
jgi:hypothetical protein